MIKAAAQQIVIENVGNRLWIVCAKDGSVTHHRRSYKTYKQALTHVLKLQDYYQIKTVTEITR